MSEKPTDPPDPRTLATEAIALAERATPGPWRVGAWIRHFTITAPGDYGPELCDADLIAHAGTHYAAIARAYLEALAALRSCIGALQNGGFVGEECSHGFHVLVPNEVAAHCREMERRLNAPQFRRDTPEDA